MALRLLLLTLALAVLHSTQAAADVLETLIAQHHCDIVERLDQIRNTKKRRDGKDRFLIVSPALRDDKFVQCIFFADDRKMLCEAASGYFLTKPGEPRRRATTPSGTAALASLGFSTDDSAGNFKREIESPDFAAHGQVARLMLSALHAAYDVNLATMLKFYAPLAMDRRRIDARCRTVG